MDVNMNDLFELQTQVRETASGVQAKDTYDVRGAGNQANRVHAEANRQAVELRKQQQTKELSMMDEYDALREDTQALQTRAHNFVAQTSEELKQTNAEIKGIRDRALGEVQDDLKRLEDINQNKVPFVKNPIGNIINRMQYRAMRSEYIADVTRYNQSSAAMQANYTRAKESIQTFVTQDYFKNVQALKARRNQLASDKARFDKVVANTALDIQSGAATGQQIYANTREDPDKQKKDLLNNKFFQYLFKIYGGEGDFGEQDATNMGMLAKSLNAEQIQALMPGFYAWDNSGKTGTPYTPKQIGMAVAQTGTLSEYGIIAAINPDAQTRQFYNDTVLEVEKTARAKVQKDYIEELTADGLLATDDKGNPRLSEDQQTILLARQQKEVGSRMTNMPFREAVELRVRKVVADNQATVIGDASDLEPNRLLTSPDLRRSLDGLVTPEAWEATLTNPEFQNEFLATEQGNQEAAGYKAVTLMQHLQKNDPDMTEAQAAEATAIVMGEFYTGKLFRNKQELVMAEDMGIEVDPKFAVTMEVIPGTFGYDNQEFRLDVASDLINLQRRLATKAEKQRKYYDQQRAATEGLILFP